MRRKVVVENNELLDGVAAMVASGERVVLLTKGQSMLPFIVGGRDSVELSRVDGEICIGDILLAKIPNPARYVIHRVIKIEGEKITLMGDGNLVGTEECSTSDVAARITTIIKPHKTINPN
ncbi:MAG: S24/S26 family peptidase [Rikenellaceae bacterium]